METRHILGDTMEASRRYLHDYLKRHVTYGNYMGNAMPDHVIYSLAPENVIEIAYFLHYKFTQGEDWTMSGAIKDIKQRKA